MVNRRRLLKKVRFILDTATNNKPYTPEELRYFLREHKFSPLPSDEEIARVCAELDPEVYVLSIRTGYQSSFEIARKSKLTNLPPRHIILPNVADAPIKRQPAGREENEKRERRGFFKFLRMRRAKPNP